MELELEGASNFYIERFEHALQGFEVAGKLGKKKLDSGKSRCRVLAKYFSK